MRNYHMPTNSLSLPYHPIMQITERTIKKIKRTASINVTPDALAHVPFASLTGGICTHQVMNNRECVRNDEQNNRMLS